MNSQNKKILLIDLDKNLIEIKTSPDLHPYVGGFAMGLKIFEMYQFQNPLIFAIGPMNGFFPYASKTAVIFKADVIKDLYIGGSLGSRIRFCDLDAIVFLGRSKNDCVIDIEDHQAKIFSMMDAPETLGLPGKKATINEGGVLDDYFETPGDFLETALKKRHIKKIVINAGNNFAIKDENKYKKQVDLLLGLVKEITVDKGFFPSCSMCPVGCAQAKNGEEAGDILLHSLVGCGFAKNILSNVNTVFSCLNVLGYHYTHEDLENLPDLVKQVISKI